MHLLSPQATLIINIMIGKHCKERNKSPLPVKKQHWSVAEGPNLEINKL